MEGRQRYRYRRVSSAHGRQGNDHFHRSIKGAKKQRNADGPQNPPRPRQAFSHTAAYDTSISNYFRRQYVSADAIASAPADQKAALTEHAQQLTLRYGANPHQKPAQAYVTEGKLPFTGESLGFARSGSQVLHD